MQTAKQLYNYIISKIEVIYGKQEAISLAFMLLENYKLSKQDYVLDSTVKVDQVELDKIISGLINHEPIQYILGGAFFYDRVFEVNQDVLIPRPETEELCNLIITNHINQPNLKILDIGTGSGCIPITLKLEMPTSNVTSLDISKGAIVIANKNATMYNTDVKFIHADIFYDNMDLRDYNLVVSNPPYVLNSEKKEMNLNVLSNEPHSALFVQDDDPIIFYRRIIELCVRDDVKYLYFEINEKYGYEIKKMMLTKGFQNICIVNDFLGKERFIHGCNKL